MEIIWRNGGTDPEGDPGDHRIKLTDTPVTMNSSQSLSFPARLGHAGILDLPSTASRSCRMGGITGSNRRTSACRSAAIPRGDSFIGATYQNVTLKKLQ